MISNTTLLIYRILQLPGVGAGTVRKCIRTKSFTQYENTAFSEEIMNKSFQMVDNQDKNNISVLSPFDDDYPPLLRLIDDFPPLLFVKGNTSLLSGTSIAVVGTRHPTKYALEVANRISKRIVSHGITVTSGLALGIDASAHRGALDGNGHTIAVLAHGLDSIAPKTNLKLAEHILDSSGALISEHEYGVKPIPAYFALRDRIQSGISIASLIIESGVPGGSIVQAKYTHQQKRKLYTIVKDPESHSSQELNTIGAEYIINNYSAIPIKNISELETSILSQTNNMNVLNNQTELF